MFRPLNCVFSAGLFCLFTGSIFAEGSFECLKTGTGPLITIDKDYGFTNYKNRDFADNTRFDAGSHVWNMQQVGEDCIGVYETTYKNAYPINLGGGANACWNGGIVVGTNPLDCGWGQLYAKVRPDSGRLNSASIVFTDCPNFIVDGIRVHNTWDAIRIGATATGFLVRNCWITYNRDDVIENDNYVGGTVDDCLFDGIYTGFSAAGSSTIPNPRPVWRIQNCLIRLQPMPNAHCDGICLQPGHKGFFKWEAQNRADGSGPLLELHDNIFMAEQPSNVSKANQSWGMGVPVGRVKSCSGNTMVWLGTGEWYDYPGSLETDKFPDGFTIVRDRSVWDNARFDWINRHPDLPRLDFDPESNVTWKGREPLERGLSFSRGPSNVELVAPNGRVVSRLQIDPRQIGRALQSLPAGVYVARIRTANESVSRQVLVSGTKE